ncbi:phenylacetate-CoA ligase [Anaerobacterium chartisolvens]|uniref:Phenylacetate-CoA ligase n=1 Tax=Anaerobacterium chartisolvens TaxID=1297424 RepID=A0A369BFJ2_9FIRM|nr:phenylacetate--CoA ligase family protein [Anaerobacterium chartisolvens]RCX20181.1 phenylacetate-CoA ligase [Anaerobacterium chartisolvens]
MLSDSLILKIMRIKSLKPVEMARYALKNTLFYKKFYKEWDGRSFDTLPVMTKYDLVGVSPYDLLSRQFKDQAYIYAETSGSSGAPTPSFLTRNDFKGLLGVTRLTPYMKEIKKEMGNNRTAVNGLTFGFTIAGTSFGALMQKHGALVAQLGTRSTIATPQRTAETIAKLKPFTISATPLDFMSWMEIIRVDLPSKHDDVIRNLKFLLSTAEPCAFSRKQQIERYFNITHVNTYASVDGLVSIPCPCGEMHLLKEMHYIELFDGQMNRIGEYGTGRLCFTGLIRKSTPMVRYMLDDVVTVKASNCEHGFKKSIMPHGRYELSMELNGKTWGNLDFEDIIYRYGLFMNYTIEVCSDVINIRLEEYPIAKNDYDITGLTREITSLTSLKCIAELLPLGSITDIRKVREAKSVIKVLDLRDCSRQLMPQIL